MCRNCIILRHIPHKSLTTAALNTYLQKESICNVWIAKPSVYPPLLVNKSKNNGKIVKQQNVSSKTSFITITLKLNFKANKYDKTHEREKHISNFYMQI